MCDIYSHKLKDDNFYVCISNEYYYCIPYNEETKHLVGTTNEAPEFYRYWEDWVIIKESLLNEQNHLL